MNDALDPLTSSRAEVPAGASGTAVMSVSAFVSATRRLLERRVPLTWIAGEISGCSRAASGHVYFTLKDADTQVRCVFYRLKAQRVDFALRDGLAVEVRATATMYEPRGEFQLNVDAVRLAGLGALYERFLRLKQRLEQAGWFDAACKRPVPPHPAAVGVVTSTRAAALRDVLTTLRRRWPSVRVVIYPASVQGDGAAGEIAEAIGRANARMDVDVLIVCRGGGSLEDLWAFNEPAVARAIHESTLPIISGVGHETDFTICDFVADVRAPTPTAAAALAVPDRAAFAQKLEQLHRRAARATLHALATREQRVDHASRRLIHPARKLAQQRDQAAALAQRLARAARRTLAVDRERAATLANRYLREVRMPPAEIGRVARAFLVWQQGRERLERLAARVEALGQNLAHLSPQAVLERGYSIVTRASGAVVQDAAELAAGDDVSLILARGRAGARIRDVQTDDDQGL